MILVVVGTRKPALMLLLKLAQIMTLVLLKVSKLGIALVFPRVKSLLVFHSTVLP